MIGMDSLQRKAALPASIPQSPATNHTVRPAVQARLLEVNRTFYAAAAGAFADSRRSLAPGMTQLTAWLRDRGFGGAIGAPAPAVLDAGCGNGRFAWALEQAHLACRYVGLDADAHLLDLAAAHTAGLACVQPHFVRGDLAAPGWAGQAELAPGAFDLVVCLAVLQHFPGFALRGRLLADLAALLSPGGRLALSLWQFGDSARLRRKILAWQTVGLTADDVEPGDALLPWNQGVSAVRYVHQVDEPELARLTAAAGLAVVHTYRADGQEGDLNLYAIMERA